MIADRYYDAPPGNEFCKPYDMLMAQASRGRSVAIVPVEYADGREGVYILSDRVSLPATQEESFRECISMVLRAREAASSENHSPVPRDR